MQEVFLSNIEYFLDKSKPLSELETLKADQDNLDTLIALGLDSYVDTSMSEYDMAINTVQKTLKSSKLGSADIEAVIYGTSSLKNHIYDKDQFSKAMCELGLDRVYPIGTFLSRCTNFSNCIRLARNLIVAEGMKNVLVILSDRVDNTLRSRVLPSYISVASDGASSFIVSSEVGDYKVLGVEHYTSQAMHDIAPNKNFTKFITDFSDGLKKLSSKLLDKVELVPADFKRMVTGNYNHSILKNYALMAGFKPNQLFLDNVPRFAHAMSSDQMIALADINNNHMISKGDKLFVMGTGDYYWGGVVVEKTI